MSPSLSSAPPIPLFSASGLLLDFYDEAFIYACVRRRLATVVRNKRDKTFGRKAILLKGLKELKAVQLGEAELKKVEQQRLDAEITAARKGVHWWNGNDRRPGAMHRPGEACS